MLPLVAIAAQFLPSLISLVAGDKAGKVANSVADVVRAVTGTDDPVQAEATLKGLAPGELLAFKTKLADIAANAESERLAAEQSDKERQHQEVIAALADVGNARKQTIDLASAKSPIAWGAPVVSVIIVGGYFVLLYVLLAEPLPQVSSNWKDLLLMLFGALNIAFGQVANYWLGSSAGSDRKTAMLAVSTPPK